MADQLTVDGKKFEGLSYSLGDKAPLLILKGSRGYLACGYISIATAERLNDVGVIVRGVKTFHDMLEAKVQEVSSEADKLGVKVGMTGREALALLA